MNEFNLTGNRLGRDWDGCMDNGGPATGNWNVAGKWEPLWACQSSFGEDLNTYLANAARLNPALRYRSLKVRLDSAFCRSLPSRHTLTRPACIQTWLRVRGLASIVVMWRMSW